MPISPVMPSALYNRDILRLAASIPHQRRLDAPQASVVKQSPVCGSRVTVEIKLDEEGRVAELGQEVRACALGQASASLMGAHALGRAPEELAQTRDSLADFPRRAPRRSGRMAGPRGLRRGAPLHCAPSLDPARLRGRRRSRRARRRPPQRRSLMGPEAADPATLVLRDGVILLGAALFFVMAFRRLGLGAVLGYLVAGALIGPDGLGLINAPDQMLNVAEIGIVLLLFLVGLELHPDRLWRLKNDIFGLGLLQVVVAGLALTALVHFAAGFSLPASLAIGLPLALSSTAQVLPSLRSDGSINTPSGERAFSILLFQDLSIVPLITIIAAFVARARR